MQKLGSLRELSSAFVDPGTLLSLVMGLIVVTSVDPVGLLYGFGLFAIATGVVCRRPIPVQPMKAVAATGIAGLASYDVLIATGILLGLTLIILKWRGVFRAVSVLAVKIKATRCKDKLKPAPRRLFSLNLSPND